MSQKEIQEQTKKWGIMNPAFIKDIAGIIANKQAEVAWKEGYNEGYEAALADVGFTRSLKEGH